MARRSPEKGQKDQSQAEQNVKLVKLGTARRAAVKRTVHAPNKPRTRRNGPTLDRPHYPFDEKQAQYLRYSDKELVYALADAKAARDIAPTVTAENWYADDVHTILAELRERGTGPFTARRNPTAWQKEMRKTSAPKRSKFEVTAVEQVREGTYRLHLDLGKDGMFPVTVYPDGHVQSGVARITPELREKIEKWRKKNDL